MTNLVLLNEALTHAMDKGYQVDVIYTDYCKAFDRIQHDLLLLKLSKIGIRGNLLRWFASYIDNRSQAVVVNNYISGWVQIPSGVPQGSLLGPLLFIIFVNDIETCFRTSQLLCFADDMKIFASISSQDDALALQQDLLRLDNYCAANLLDLNPVKCSVVTFSRKRSEISYDYFLKGVCLPRDSVVRDLAVYHDSKLLCDVHIDKMISKAYKALGFVMRSSRDFKNVKTFKILYCTYVRSNLEYASQIWNPGYVSYIDKIKNIQKKFLKYVCYRTCEKFKRDNYARLCKRHHLLPLVDRRNIADIIFLLKICSSSIDCPDLLSKIQLVPPFRILRNNCLINLPTASTNYRQNSFLVRASRNFNNLCIAVDLDLFCTGSAAARRLLTQLFFEA